MNNITVLQPEKVRDPKFLEEVGSLAPDLIVVHAFGQILPKTLFEIPKFGVINVHYSLLPRYRGAAPVQWAILNGEKETGIAIMQMDEKLDTGAILLEQAVVIGESDTTGTLLTKLSELGREFLISAVKGLKAGTLKPIPQDDTKATYAPPIAKEQGKIDWKEGIDCRHRYCSCISRAKPHYHQR
jgi:methionyl-tRNA formyltransferase